NELEPGDHELTLLFGDQEVTARFTVLEHEEESSEEVPTEPTEELPTEPTEELPTEPTEELPTELTDAPAPTEPIDTSAVENRRLGPFWVSLVALLGIGLLIYYRIMKRGEPKNVYVAPPEKDPQTIASQLAVDAGLMSPAAQAKIEETVEERTAEADEKATNAEESTADPAKLTEDPAESTDADAPEATAEEVKE
ncbi:MAG: hypothetical protein J6Z38_03015, partial [Lachnospiraceae bacterium]|nr:hypothetical protein [Lachnospiraceae bacterium]